MLLIGWAFLYPSILSLVSISETEYKHVVALAAFGIVCLVVGHVARLYRPLSRERVDVVYYTLGIVGVVLFLFSNAQPGRPSPLANAYDVGLAASRNQLELAEAAIFSQVYHGDSDRLIAEANTYLESIEAGNVVADCVQDFRQWDGSNGLIITDNDARLLRSSMGLSNTGVSKVIEDCEALFGGRRFTQNLLTFAFPRSNKPISPGILPLSSVNSEQEFRENLHVFLPMELHGGRLSIAAYIEFILGEGEEWLTPDQVAQISSPTQPPGLVDLTWADRQIARLASLFRNSFEQEVWPIIAIYLFALKIASRARSKPA